MNTRYCLVLIISLLFLACACSRSPVMQSLDHAESLMDEHPDSALTMLEAIDGSSLSGESQARYALLLSQAYDKNYIDLTSDSLIGIAAGYYENHSDDRCLMMCNYYKGVVQFNAADYTHCIVSLTKAESLAQKLDDNFYLGRIYTLMGDLYNSTYNSEAQLKCRKLAVAAFSKVNNPDYVKWSLLDLALGYIDNKEYDHSILMLDSLIANADDNVDDTFIVSALGGKLEALISNGGYTEASSVVNEIQQICDFADLPLSIKSDIVNLHIYKNELDSASYHFNCMDSRVQQTLPMMMSKQLLYEKSGNYKNAYNLRRNIINVQDSMIFSILGNSVVASQRDYFNRLSITKESEAKDFKAKMLFVLFSVFCLSGFAIFVLRMKMIRKNEQINRIIGEAEELTHVISRQECKIESLNSKVGDYYGDMIKKSEMIEKLFHDQFVMINDLCYRYFENKNDERIKNLIFLDVVNQIKLFSSREYMQKLEQILNSCHNDIMRKLRQQLTVFKEDDIKFMLYFIAGFSPRAICLFLNISMGNYYNKRTRLKARIIESKVDDKDLFLNFFVK